MSSRVRDAMIVDPPALEGSASAQEAGQLFLRPEVRFDGLDSLKAQMERDCEQARAVLARL